MKTYTKGNRISVFGFESLGKFLILMGAFIVILGLLMTFWNKIPILGKLPGDISFQNGNFRFYFPVVTCLVLSIVLTVIINLILRLFGK